MTPAATNYKERTVEGIDTKRNIKIKTGDGEIEVVWLCGGSRTFTPDELTRAVDRMDRYSQKVEGFWLTQRDSRQSRFYAHVNPQGRITANDGSAFENGWVPWDKLRTELRAAIREAAKSKSSPTTT